MYVLERIKTGGKIETETGTFDELIQKLYEVHPHDEIQPISEHGHIKGTLVISVNPGRSEGRYLYEVPDIKIPA